jgi:lipoprotein-anchoring transpeptidase ErfK/SrfK
MSQRFIFTLVVFLTAANILVWSFLGFTKAYAQKVYPGIWVHAQPLAGLTRDQVIDRLKPINEAMLKEKVQLTLDNKEYTPTLAELGYQVDTGAMADAALNLGRGYDFKKVVLNAVNYQRTKDIPLTYAIDQQKFSEYLNKIKSDIAKEPKNISLDYQNGGVVIVHAEEGYTIDKEQLRADIQREVKPGQTPHITLAYQKTPAALANESQVAQAKTQLSKLLAQPLKLQAEEVTAEFSPTEVYALTYFEIKDNTLVLSIDENKVATAVGKFAKKVDISPVSKQVNEPDGSIIQEGKDGRQLNIPDTSKRILERLRAGDLVDPLVLKVDPVSRKTVTISPEFQTGRFEGRYLEVDLSSQRMHLIEGTAYHRTFIISTGKWSTPTPIGTFAIKNHIAVAWSNPFKLFMPQWMGLQKAEDGVYEGYGIHGLPYWPSGVKEGVNHLGRPVSHGCIRLGPDDAPYVYDWAGNGTHVVIHQ